MQKTAFERANDVIQTAHLEDIFALERSGGSRSNEVWFYGPYVIRVQAQAGSKGTLEGEMRLLRNLPSSIPHAPIVAAGESWIVQRRGGGEPLSKVWSSLPISKRRAAAQQIAAILINLHQVRISGMPSLPPGWFTGLLPAEILRLAAQLHDHDTALMNTVSLFTRKTMADIKPPLRWGFIHRDLHFDHVLWNGERVTALLDFESAVIAPRELELETIMRFCRYPSLYGDLTAEDLEPVLGWLQEDYPLLFNEAGIDRRLKLYSLEHELRLLASGDDSGALDRLRVTLAG
ncbi:MAG: phosphotransferase [Chloroflexi bacterium]|nr:phosphotransferase [Chloroflexota bacterium]